MEAKKNIKTSLQKKDNSLLSNPSPTLLYDGFCFLCSSSAKFIRRIDKKKKISFLALQSNDAQKILQKHQFPIKDLDTVYILHQNQLFKKSEAVFEVMNILGGGWRLFYIFKIIPLGLRDLLYDFVAKNRYRWFGKKDSCEL